MSATPPATTEREVLRELLEAQREGVLRVTENLSAAELDHRLPTSALSSGGILNHLAYVEDWWFQEILLGLAPVEPWASAPFDTQPDWDFEATSGLTAEVLTARYREAIARSNEAMAGLDLNTMSATAHRGDRFALRWILVHLIEETAHHLGHLDMITDSLKR
jgi:uncharacterized damage-inducible protein DinB